MKSTSKLKGSVLIGRVAVFALALLAISASVVLVSGCTSSNSSASNGATGSSVASAKAEVTDDDMPVPDFSKLFKLSSKEAEEYLAAYPHDSDSGSYYSSLSAMKAGGVEYLEEPSAKAWELDLLYSDDSQTCTRIDFSIAPLSSYNNLVSSETFAAAIQNYLSDYNIQEMTIAIMDGSSKNIGERYDGYILFDDLVATVGSFSSDEYCLTVYPASGKSNWEKVKARIADGKYRDVHSGGITYTYPYYDVYTISPSSSSTASSSASSTSLSSASASSSSFVGTWTMTGAIVDGVQVSAKDVGMEGTVRISLEQDGSAVLESQGESAKGTWKESNGTATMTFGGETFEIAINDGRLEFNTGEGIALLDRA